MQNLKFDISITGTIIDDSDKENGKYLIATENAKFYAFSENQTFNINDLVTIIIPQGNFNNQKYIIGRKNKTANDPYIYKKPLQNFIDITGNLINNSTSKQIYSIAANGSSTIENNTWIQNPETGLYMLPVWNQSFDTNHLIFGYQFLALVADFSSYLKYNNILNGNYGLCLKLTYLGNKEELSKYFYLDSKDFFGNPYQFDIYQKQELCIDIGEISLFGINNIELYFYEKHNFIDYNFAEYLNNLNLNNLYVTNIVLCFGYDKTLIQTDIATIIATNNNEDSPFAIDEYSTAPDQLYLNQQKQLYLNWVTITSKVDTNNYVYGINWYYYEVGADYDEISGGSYVQFAQTAINEAVIFNPAEHSIKTKDVSNIRYVLPTQQVKGVIVKRTKASDEWVKVLDSNILTFTNLDTVSNTSEEAQSLELLTINLDDNTSGHYYYYNRNNSLSTEQNYLRYFSLNFRGVSLKNQDILQIPSVTWTFYKNSMIVPYVDGKVIPFNQAISGEFTQNGIDYNYSTIIDEQTMSITYTSAVNAYVQQGYKLRSLYSSQWLDNEVAVTANIKGWSALTATIGLSFGQYGQHDGTSYIMDVSYVDNKNFIGLTEARGDCTQTNDFILNVSIYDEHGQQVDFNFDQCELAWEIAEHGLEEKIIRKPNFEENKRKYPIIFDNNLIISTVESHNEDINSNYENITLNDNDYLVNNTYYIDGEEYLINHTSFANKEDIFTYFANGNGLPDQIFLYNKSKKTFEDLYYIYSSSGDWDYIKNDIDARANLVLYAYPQPESLESIIPTPMRRKITYQEVVFPNKTEDEDEYFYEINGQQFMFKPQKYFIKDTNQNFIIDPYEEYNTLLTYYVPHIEDIYIEEKVTPLVATIQNNQIYVRLNKTYYSIHKIDYLNSLSVLKVCVKNVNGFNLTQYVPIVFKDNDVFTNIVNMKGATAIQYASNGIDATVLGSDQYYFILNNDESILATDIRIFYLNANPTFVPEIKDSRLIPQKTYVKEQHFGLQLFKNNILVFSLPLFMYQELFPIETINQWSGKGLSIDKEGGTILGRNFAAGKKEADNTFSGVIMGDWQGTSSDSELESATGLYGFHQGAMSYAFKDDGTGFIGKDGRGRIYFNGNKSVIYSSQWLDKQLGMALDLDNGILESNQINSAYKEKQFLYSVYDFYSRLLEQENEQTKPFKITEEKEYTYTTDLHEDVDNYYYPSMFTQYTEFDFLSTLTKEEQQSIIYFFLYDLCDNNEKNSFFPSNFMEVNPNIQTNSITLNISLPFFIKEVASSQADPSSAEIIEASRVWATTTSIVVKEEGIYYEYTPYSLKDFLKAMWINRDDSNTIRDSLVSNNASEAAQNQFFNIENNGLYYIEKLHAIPASTVRALQGNHLLKSWHFEKIDYYSKIELSESISYLPLMLYLPKSSDLASDYYLEREEDQKQYITLSSTERTYGFSMGADKVIKKRNFKISWNGQLEASNAILQGQIQSSHVQIIDNEHGQSIGGLGIGAMQKSSIGAISYANRNNKGIALFLGDSPYSNQGVFKITPQNLGWNWSLPNKRATAYFSTGKVGNNSMRLHYGYNVNREGLTQDPEVTMLIDIPIEGINFTDDCLTTLRNQLLLTFSS